MNEDDKSNKDHDYQEFSKGVDMFVKFFKEIYGNLYESLKLSQDYLKVLVPSNTATILILIAFMDRVFRASRYKYVLLASFLCFGVSLLSALRTMRLIEAFYGLVSSAHMDTLVLMASGSVGIKERKEHLETIKKNVEETAAKEKFWGAAANYLFFGGFVVLIIFVVMSFVS